MSSNFTTTQSLLRQAFPPSKAQTIFTERVQRKPLVLNGTIASARDLRRHHHHHQHPRKPKRKPAPLTAREKRALHIHEIPASARKYALYEPLHRLWIGYMQEILCGAAGASKEAFGVKLASADYHGAEMEVVRSGCPSRVGVKGVCVKETRGMFYIVTEKDAVKEIPKEHTVFRFQVPVVDREGVPDLRVDGTARNMVFELHGSQFMYRAADRAGRKFKQKPVTDL